MRRLTSLLLFALLSGCAAKPAAAPSPKPATPTAAAAPAPVAVPPVAKRQGHSATLHGQSRTDDYHWLRQKDAPDVLAYLKAENAYTEAVMKPTEPLQQRLYDEMLGRIKQTDLSVPFRKDGWLYYSRTEEGKEYPIHCRKKGTLEGKEEILLDLNEMRKGEKFISLGDREVSDDGNLLAYSTDTTGFRVYTLRVKDLRSGELLPTKIEAVTSVAWAKDGKTLFYTTEDETKRSNKLWRHVLGARGPDTLQYEEKDERFTIAVGRTRSGGYLLAYVASHTTSEIRYLKADRPSDPWKIVAAREQDHEYDVDHRADTFYIRTNDQGRHFRLVKAPVASPGRKSWKEVIPHREDVMLEGVDLFKDHYVVFTRKDALPHLAIAAYDAKGKASPHEIAFDEAVYAAFPDTNEEFDSSVYRFSYMSFVTPKSVFDYDVKTKERKLLKRTEVLGGYDASLYTSERLTATAPDGTKVPISLVYKKGLAKDGRAPLLLYGYGSYGASIPVFFDSNRVSLLDRGVVYALAHIRGGGDLGKKWHDDGRMLRKKNSFTDFIACAEHLIAQRYTSRERLAINGGSAGGLLMGAVVNMRPDLFKAVVAEVPFVDVVNTMLDETLPLTVGEFEEWGNPKEKPAFDYMLSYSPYDNVTRKDYPAMLVVSAYNDSQVMYFEPAKWVAKLRAEKTDANPLLLKMDLDPAGHGGKSGRYEKLREEAFVNAFILNQLGVEKQER